MWGSNSRPSDFCFGLWDWRAAFCANEALLLLKLFSWVFGICYRYFIYRCSFCCIAGAFLSLHALPSWAASWHHMTSSNETISRPKSLSGQYRKIYDFKRLQCTVTCECLLPYCFPFKSNNAFVVVFSRSVICIPLESSWFDFLEFQFFKKKCFLEKNNYISSDQSLSVLSSRTVFQWESRSEQCGTVSPFPANKSSLYTRTSLGMV